jgi:lipopolysaccharide/colanic/teichoic acid biosynthesis glycosyltransferase
MTITTSKKSKLFYNAIKRAMDIVLSLIAIVLLSPVLLVVALAIAIDNGFPVLFCQPRAGLKNKAFTIFKFRTMRKKVDTVITFEPNHIPDDFVFKSTGDNDAHYTRIGGFLRKWSLDELPQFFNVLQGTMSIVGPRPELIEITRCYDANQSLRLEVKPGITGLAQVSGRSLLTHKEKIAFDLQYYSDCSLGMDVKIMFLTVLRVLGRQNAV